MPEYSSSVLFSNISPILSENIIERNLTAGEKYSKLILQICSSFKILFICPSYHTRVYHHTHTWELSDLRTDLAIIYSTTKSSKGKELYMLLSCICPQNLSLCSLLEWSQDINIKHKIFRIKTHTDKIISNMYTTAITCKKKKKNPHKTQNQTKNAPKARKMKE